MNYVEQEIVFRTEGLYGADVPLSLSSPLLRRLESIARPSLRMVLEGSSTSVGAPPAWLERASDIRTLGFSGKAGVSVLHLKAPKLGDAAPALFEQQSLWPSLTSPDETAVQVIARIATAVRQREAASDLYDRPLLKHLSSWSGLFKRDLKSVDFLPGNGASGSPSQIDAQVTANAQKLSDETPSPRQVRIVGKLDMVRHSTRSFGLILDDGEEIRGVLIEGASEVLQGYFGKDITVLGKAIYRPSGTLLRIDASQILPSVAGRHAFSKVPPSLTQSRKPERRTETSTTLRRVRTTDGYPTNKGGVASFFGSWPGEETDQELLDALEEIRS